MTSVLSSAKMYGQFALGLRRFLKNPPQPDAARAEVEKNLRNREGNFLRIAQHGIYDNPRSPYLKLLRNSGVELGDLVRMTEADVAIDQSPVQVPGSTLVVDAFCFTALLPTVPKIIFNVELDDYGILDQRDCGCPMQAAGFPDHVRDVFSFRKLTGEGMTLVGSTMLRIMEEVLPTKFGGTALDYQLVEEEDENGFTRLTFVVSPRVGSIDEKDLIDTVLDEVSRDSPGADLARAVWRDAGTLRVRREDPTWSTLGKLLSLRPAKRNAGIVFDANGERPIA